MQEKLILLRTEKGIKQKTLATILGITPKVKFNGDEMFLISGYFKLPIDQIFLPTIHQNGELESISNQEGGE